MDAARLTFRNKVEAITNSDEYFIAVAAISFTLSVWLGSPGYLLGISAVLIMLWANRWSWGIIGLKKVSFIPSAVKATLYAIAIFIVIDILVQPFVEKWFGEIDISSLDGLRGNLLSYLIFIVVMWVVAAFGEEFFYRGFLMKRLAQMLGDTNKTWLIGALVSAIYFGLAHMYQGWSGVITTGIIGFIVGLIFMKEKTLLIPILIHGIYDMIGITLIYLDKERVFIDWINGLLV